MGLKEKFSSVKPDTKEEAELKKLYVLKCMDKKAEKPMSAKEYCMAVRKKMSAEKKVQRLKKLAKLYHAKCIGDKKDGMKKGECKKMKTALRWKRRMQEGDERLP